MVVYQDGAVKRRPPSPSSTRISDERLHEADLDLGYLALFVGMRMNALVLEALHRGGFAGLREAHGYVFQHLLAGPRTVSDLAELLGVSQQAASKSVAELVSLGFLEDVPSADRRARTVALSAHGRACIARGRDLRAKRERALVARHGDAIDRTRALLAQILEEIGGAEMVRARRVRQAR
jgi:DNA-binding MarR family transcriptional regulator